MTDYTTVHVVLPAGEAPEFVDTMRKHSSVVFAGSTDDVSPDALTAGADPSSWDDGCALNDDICVPYTSIRESLALILGVTTDPDEILKSLDDAVSNNAGD
jgi:hypothetical protein